MFPDYERLVLEDYLQKRTANKLPLNLSMPSPARLKEECERVCMERFERKDEAVIRAFFGRSGDRKESLKIIQDSNIDSFRPLGKYLRTGGITKPEPKNIELLAWLIDFQDRPFILGKRYLSKEVVGSTIKMNLPIEDYSDDLIRGQHNPEPVAEVNIIGASKPVQATENNGSDEEGARTVSENAASVLKVLPAWRYWNAVVASALLLLAWIAGFQSWDKKENVMLSSGNGGCMYWAGDHYQPIPCHQKVPNTLVLALDTLLVKHFRKITQPDTITNRAIGWVWYSKIHNVLEYFTSDGEHPVVIGRRLKPITEYMIEKHIKQGIASGQ